MRHMPCPHARRGHRGLLRLGLRARLGRKIGELVRSSRSLSVLIKLKIKRFLSCLALGSWRHGPCLARARTGEGVHMQISVER